jgi:hypothetical protein
VYSIKHRVLKPKFIAKWAVTIFVFVFVPLGVSTAIPSGTGMFASSTSDGDAGTIWLMIICALIFIWTTGFMLWMTLKKREMPLHFRTVEVAEEALLRQMHIDEKFCKRIGNAETEYKSEVMPPDRLYEWPWWSIGHGLVTTGPRRVLAPALAEGHEIEWKHFKWVTWAMVMIPVFVLFPVAFELQDLFGRFERTPGVTLTAFLVFAGLPITWGAFYGSRLLWGVFPARLKVVASHHVTFIFLFIGYVLPVGVLYPIAQQAKTIESWVVEPMMEKWFDDSIHLLPISATVCLLSPVIIYHRDTWRWFVSLRIELQYRLYFAEFVNKNVRWIAPIPFFLFVFSAVLLVHWEDKMPKVVETYIILQVCLGVIFIFFAYWSRVAAVWLDHVSVTHGPERAPITIAYLTTLISIISCALQVSSICVHIRDSTQKHRVFFCIPPPLPSPHTPPPYAHTRPLPIHTAPPTRIFALSLLLQQGFKHPSHPCLNRAT